MAGGGSSRQRRNRARGAARATRAAEAGAVAQNSSGTTQASSGCGWQGANIQGDREATAGTVGREQLLGSGGSGGCGKAELLWVAKG